MKSKLVFLAIVLFFMVLNPLATYSQDISLCQLIGKDSKEVIKKFGKPQHHDKTNPAMECIFYQSKTSRMAFIADQEGVYQIQIDFLYNSPKEAKKAIDDFLTDCCSKSLKVDTLNTGDYKIMGSGVKMSLTLFENSFSKKYEVKFKADRSTTK